MRRLLNMFGMGRPMAVHLPGGTVQQGYKCDGSLRARAGTRNLGSLKSGPGPIVNQTLPKSNPVKEVGKNQRLRTVGFRIARAVGVLTPQSFPRTRMRLTEMVCCSGGGSGSTYCVSRHEKPRFTEKWARSYRESDPASICGLLGQRPATTAMSQLRISQSSAHLPGGTVQQGYKFGGSLRARAGTRNLGSLKSGPGPIVNQTLPKSNPVKEVGKI